MFSDATLSDINVVLCHVLCSTDINAYSSVVDLDSLNPEPDPDPAFPVNPDPGTN
jgi:hypothetical protein